MNVRPMAHCTGAVTIPRIFIGGEHVGGCTELFDVCRDGNLMRTLQNAGVACGGLVDFDPYELLPQWLQPRKSA